MAGALEARRGPAVPGEEMTKIKNFKINLRPREIARWLKKERGVESTPELELAIEQLIKESKPWVEPAAVYSTLTRAIAENTTPLVFADKSIAVSIVAVSVGPRLEEERLTARAHPSREALLAALGQEALTQTLQFAVRLIQDQAKEEDCEMPAAAAAPLPEGGVEPSMVSSLATLVGIQRIGIEIDPSAPALPPYARVAWLFWTPVGKGAAKRAEKAVA